MAPDNFERCDQIRKKFSYRLVGPVPLPVSDYVGTFHVVEGRRGYRLITWSSAYRNNSDGRMKDEEVMGFVGNAF
jgi:hypothetical protein